MMPKIFLDPKPAIPQTTLDQIVQNMQDSVPTIVVWDMAVVYEDNPRYDEHVRDLLLEGWEPYGVTSGATCNRMYFRRQVTIRNPKLRPKEA